jgi:membrane protein
MQKIKNALHMIYKAGDNLVDHDGVELAGYLSFLTMLAFFPFLVFLFALLGALGETNIGIEYVHSILDQAPKYIANAIMPRIEEIISGPPPALITISILGAIWTASSIVEGVRTVLNRAYHVQTPPNYYWRRSISILQMVLLTLFLIVAMFALVLIPNLFTKIYAIFSGADYVAGREPTMHDIPFFGLEWEFIRQSLFITTLLFFVSALYHILPNVKQSWLRTLPGAAIVVFGWLMVVKAYTYYLLHFNQMNLIYGSLANIIAFLVFFYIQNIVFIYGAEFNYLLERKLGHKIEEKEKVKVTKKSEHDKK